MKHKAIICLVSLALLTASGSVIADDNQVSTDARASLTDQSRQQSANDEVTSDTWLKAKLVTTILLNRHLSVFDIDADVRQQVAFLTGIVDSDIDKDLAEEVAKSIDGIKSVKNELVVDQTRAALNQKKREQSTSRSFGQRVEDLTTTASVKSKLLTNSNVSGLAINVDTVNNEVTLNGEVKSDEERALVEQITKNTQGVFAVKNRLRVEPTKG